STLRRGRMLPLHDVRSERAAAEHLMAELADRMKELGGAAEASGHYALGRGWLALGDDEKARAHLTRAWEMGDRRPEVAFHVGWALSMRYRSERAAAATIASKDAREARLSEIAARW